MPMRQMLERGIFDQKTAALLLEVFDHLVAEFDLRAEAEREKAAKIIARVARRQATLDPPKIRAEVVRLMRKGVRRHRRPF
jgi:hypothetical protein